MGKLVRKNGENTQVAQLEAQLEEAQAEIVALKKREIKATLDRANIQYLLYSTRELTGIQKLQDMIPLVLERLQNTFKSFSFGLLIEANVRPSVIEYMGFSGFSEEEKAKIVRNHHQITNDASTQDDNSISFLDDDFGDNGVPSSREGVSSPSHEKSLVYGGDVEGITRLLSSGQKNEQWMVLSGNIGEYNDLKLFLRSFPIDGEQLSTIRLFLSLVSAWIHNHLLKIKLQKLANCDALTSLLNRGGFDSAFEQYKHMAKATSQFVFSIIAIDVNGLKYVNDTFGHEAGDKLIRTVAEILGKSCRKTDVISRSGGDEFVILCPDTDTERSQPIVERIRSHESTAQLTFCKKGSTETESVNVRVSLGVADSREFSPDAVLREADHRESLNKQEYYKTHKRYR